MRLKSFVVVLVILIISLTACKGRDKNSLYQDGLDYRKAGNSQGAIVLFKNALDMDPNFFDARLGLAQAYMDLAQFPVAENEFQKVLLQDPNNLEALVGMSEIRLRSDRAKESLEPLKESLLAHPNDLRLLNLLGRAYAGQQQFDDAEKVFNQVLNIDSANETAKLNLARLQIVQKNSPAAKIRLNQILETNPSSVKARILLARLLGVEGDREGALTQYLEASRLSPRNGEALYAAGLLALDLNDLPRAESILDTLQKNFPKNPACDRIQGLLDFRKNNFSEAAAALQKALKSQPDLLSFYFLGLSHYQLGEFEQAISQFQKGLDMNPGHVSLRVNLAQTLLKKGRVDDAISELQKALHYDANSALAHSVLGSAYLIKGDFEKASEMLDRAAMLNPQLAEVHLKKGIFNLQNGDMNLGEAELEKAVNLSPELLDSRLTLAAHYLQQQNFSEAVKLINEGLKGQTEDAILYNYLAAAYFGQKNTSQAVEALRKSIQHAPNYPTPYLNLAATFLNEGDYPKAIRVYRDALVNLPKNVRILISLASVLELRGEESEALELFHRAAATGEVQGVSSLTRYYLLKNDLVGALEVLEEEGMKGDSHPVLLELKAGIQLKLGLDDGAFETLLQWTRIDPESGASALVSYYLRKGDQKAALALAGKLIGERNNSGLGHWLKAKIQVQLGTLNSARQSVAEGLGRDPQNIQLKALLAEIYQREGNLAKAEQTFNQIIIDQPNYYPALFALGAQKDKSGEKSQARQLYEKTLNINHQYIPALNNLAYLLTENYGANKEALELAVKAYRQLPSSPEVMDTLGYVLLKNTRFAEAVPLLEKAHDALPDQPTVQLHLGMAYQGLGQPQKARDILEKVLVAGSQDEVREARRILQVKN